MEKDVYHSKSGDEEFSDIRTMLQKCFNKAIAYYALSHCSDILLIIFIGQSLNRLDVYKYISTT